MDKRVAWSDTGYDTLEGKNGFTVWRPTHFALEYGRLVDAVHQIDTRRVILVTVPHVTIAPIAKGVNPAQPGQKWREGSRYFPYYTDPWIEETDFNPTKHRYITHQQARAIDSAIDQYNAMIADSVRHARSQGRDWYVFDMRAVLDGLARRRYATDDQAARRNDWEPHHVPPEFADLDTRFLPLRRHRTPPRRTLRPRRRTPHHQRLRRPRRRPPRRPDHRRTRRQTHRLHRPTH